MKLPASALLVYALVFCTELGQSMLFPLLPGFADEFALSDARTGAVLAASTLATVAAALPAGRALRPPRRPLRLRARRRADRRSPPSSRRWRPRSRCCSLGRVIFGVAFAAVWTAGTTLVADSAGHRALGISIVVGGLAHLAGPAGRGRARRRVRPRAAVRADGRRRGASSPPAWRSSRRPTSATAAAPSCAPPRGPRSSVPVLRSAMLLIALVGTLTGVVGLVVPLLLDREGLSPTQIGGVFALGSVLWVASSLAAVRAGTRAVSAGRGGRRRGADRHRGADARVHVGRAVRDRLRRAARAAAGAALDDQLPARRAGRPRRGRGHGHRDGADEPRLGRVRGGRAGADRRAAARPRGAQLVFVTLAALCAVAGVAMLRAAPRAPAYA